MKSDYNEIYREFPAARERIRRRPPVRNATNVTTSNSVVFSATRVASNLNVERGFVDFIFKRLRLRLRETREASARYVFTQTPRMRTKESRFKEELFVNIDGQEQRDSPLLGFRP